MPKSCSRSHSRIKLTYKETPKKWQHYVLSGEAMTSASYILTIP